MTTPINILIVDDELQSRLLIRQLVTRQTGSFVISEAESVTTALQSISDTKPDLLFLDVQLRGETGFDLLDLLAELQLSVIFVTAHNDYAVRAFRYHALDYLLKPIDPIEFDLAFGRVLAQKHSSSPGERYHQLSRHIEEAVDIPDKVAIPTTDGYLFLDMREILYCRAAGNYTELWLAGKKKVLSSYTLGYYEGLLLEHHFFRVHRSCLINLRHIRKYKRGDGGTVLMEDDMEIEVSRTNKEAFLKLFKP